MKISNLKTINEASEKDVLKFILATQLQILRRLDFIENKPVEKEKSHFETTKEMINEIDPSLARIDEYLSLDNLEKGQLKF